MSHLLTAQGLGHKFDRWLFRKVSFELSATDRLVITGANGSGKSTLLKILAGLIRQREGQVYSNTTVGYSAIDLAVYPQLTAREHLEIAARLRDCSPDVNENLLAVGLDGAENQVAGTFSTGMRARLKMALAIQHSPMVLLLDEPTASLDEDGRECFHRIITDFPGAVVIATNDEQDRKHATHELRLD